MCLNMHLPNKACTPTLMTSQPVPFYVWHTLYQSMFLYMGINYCRNVLTLCYMYVILQVPEETNILTDGCLIDLCGVTLMWRTAIGLEQGPVSMACIH